MDQTEGDVSPAERCVTSALAWASGVLDEEMENRGKGGASAQIVFITSGTGIPHEAYVGILFRQV